MIFIHFPFLYHSGFFFKRKSENSLSLITFMIASQELGLYNAEKYKKHSYKKT